MKHIKYFIFLLRPLFCFADFPDEFASLETDLEFIIDGKVNVISGAFIDVKTDLVIPSIFPLSVTRSSIPFEYESGRIWEGWHLNYCGSCEVNYLNNSPHKARIRDENGTPLFFTSQAKGSFSPIAKSYAKGETNLGREIIGGKVSIRNYKANLGKDRAGKIILKTGGGVRKTFEGGNGFYEFERLETSSGFVHELNKKNPLSLIKKSYSANSQEIGLMILDSVDPKILALSPRVVLYAGDGRNVEYLFKVHYNTKYDDPKKCYGLLNSVKYSNKHWIQYGYDDHTAHHKERCILKKEPDDVSVEMTYYTPGEKNGVMGVSISNQNDWKELFYPIKNSSVLCDRVKTLIQPAQNDQKVETKRFIYHLFEDKKGGIGGGRTDVYDYYNHLSTYSYNKEYRPTEIIHYKGYPHSYSQEIKQKLFWGDPKKDKEGFLTARLISSEKGPEYKARSFEYDDHGNIKKEIFFGMLTGNSCSKVVFNEIGQAQNETESFNKSYQYSKDELNNLKKELHENGLKIIYTYYDQTDRLKTKTIRASEFEQNFSYNYHPCGALVEVVQKDNRTCLITRHTPNLSQPCYGFAAITSELYKDSNQEVPLKTTHFKYNRYGKPELIEVFDGEGQFAYCERFENYDEIGCCQSETLRTLERIERSFDAHGNITEERGPQNLYIKQNKYDKMCRLKNELITLKDGTTYTTAYSYNVLGGLIGKTDPYGALTDYENDRYNRPIKTTYPQVDGIRPFELKEYDIFGNVISFQDRKEFITKTTYNAYDKPTLIQYPDGGTERFEYNKDGSLKTSTDANGLTTLFETDCLGRVRKKTLLDPEKTVFEEFTYDCGLLKSWTDYNGVVTLYDYDGAGRKSSEIVDGAKTTFSYDSLGRLSKTSQYDKNVLVSTNVEIFDVADRVAEKWIEDANGQRFQYERYEYDPLGNRKLEEKGGFVTTFEYDGLSRIVKKTDPQGYETHWFYSINPHQETQIDPDGVSTIQTFDPLNRLVLKEKYCKNQLLSSVKYKYDLNDNMIDEIHQVIGQDKTYHIIRDYDEMNRLKVIIEPLGKKTEHTYTKSGKIKTTLKPDGVLLTYIYNLRGQLKSLQSTDLSIDYTFKYDAMNNLLSVSDDKVEVTRTYTPRGQLETDTYLGKTVEYTYDDLDRITKITLPDDSTIEYEYNPLGISKVKRNALSHSYLEFDRFGHPILELLIDNSTREKEYDSFNRLKKIQHPDFSQYPLNYDCMGNLLEAGTNTYTYDQLHQLTSETGQFNNQFSFDSIYNPRQKNFNSIKVNDLNQVDSDLDYTYTYDDNGNLATKAGPHQSWIFTYDHLDRLTSVNSKNVTTSYQYDGLHRRLLRHSPSYSETYWFIGDNEVASFNGSSSSLRVLGIGLGAEIGSAVLIELNGTPFTPHHDHAGNLVRLGQFTNSFSAFGESPFPPSLPWGFASKRYDPETGFISFGRRYYDPTLSRWISCDPLGFTAGINLYAYVNNSPLTHYDEYGLMILPSFSIQSTSARMGMFHGMVDYGMNFAQGIHSMFYSLGQSRLDLGAQESSSLRDQFHQTQSDQFSALESWVQNTPAINPSDPLYQSFRSGSSTFLECASLATGVYGLAKGGIKALTYLSGRKFSQFGNFSHLAKPSNFQKTKLLETFEKRISQLNNTLDLNALSEAGKVMDRAGLTKAGRALDKHGNRINSPFPKATGNYLSKNSQGQFHLEDILSHPDVKIIRGNKGDLQLFSPDGRGAHFRPNGTFKGFLDYEYE